MLISGIEANISEFWLFLGVAKIGKKIFTAKPAHGIARSHTVLHVRTRFYMVLHVRADLPSNLVNLIKFLLFQLKCQLLGSKSELYLSNCLLIWHLIAPLSCQTMVQNIYSCLYLINGFLNLLNLWQNWSRHLLSHGQIQSG